MRWSEDIGLKVKKLFQVLCCSALIATFIPELEAADTLSSQEIQQMKDKASNLAGATKSYSGSPRAIRENVVNPATGVTQMQTIDRSVSFDGTLQCSNPVDFVKLSVVPNASSGDITTVKVSINKDLQGGYDSVYDVTSMAGGVVSGVCANGFVSCDPGTWSHCRFFKWKVTPDFNVTVEATTDLMTLGGCYCFNNSCAPQNYVVLNVNQILGHLGGGLIGVIHVAKPDVSVSGGTIQNNAIVYTASLPTGCASSSSNLPTGYWDNPEALTQDVSAIQANPPTQGVYSDLQAAFNQQGFDSKLCRATRGISCGCPEGYTYDSNIHKCVAEPSCPEGTYPDGGECVCKHGGGEGYTCNCAQVFDCGIDTNPVTICDEDDETGQEDCKDVYYGCDEVMGGCGWGVCCAKNKGGQDITYHAPPKCSVYLSEGMWIRVYYKLSNSKTHGGAEWCINVYDVALTGPNSFTKNWTHRSFSYDASLYGPYPNKSCPSRYDVDCAAFDLTVDETVTVSTTGWYDVTLYYFITNYWGDSNWQLKVIAEHNCPPGGQYDPNYSKCVATPTTDISITENCSQIDQDPTCKIYYERVDLGDNVIPSQDDVFTVKDFLSTGITLQDQCKEKCDGSGHVCYPWWLKERSYLCQAEQYDFNKERIKTVISSAQQNNPQSTVATYTDKRLNENNQWVVEQGSIERADYQISSESCVKACKVKKTVPNTQTTGTGGTTSQSQIDPNTSEFYYRECTNNTCPYNPSQGESVVINCQCINEFGEAAVVLSALQEASEDLICSSGQKQ